MRQSGAVGDRRFVADRPSLSPASIGMCVHALVTAILALLPLGQVVGVLSTVVFGGVGYVLVPAVLIGTLVCAWSLLRRDMVTYATATALIWLETWEWAASTSITSGAAFTLSLLCSPCLCRARRWFSSSGDGSI